MSTDYVPNITDIKRYFLAYSRGSLDIWALSGNQNAKARQYLMQAITGNKVTQTNSGVTNLRTKLYELAHIDASHMTIRDAERLWFAWLQED